MLHGSEIYMENYKPTSFLTITRKACQAVEANSLQIWSELKKDLELWSSPEDLVSPGIFAHFFGPPQPGHKLSYNISFTPCQSDSPNSARNSRQCTVCINFLEEIGH